MLMLCLQEPAISAEPRSLQVSVSTPVVGAGQAAGDAGGK